MKPWLQARTPLQLLWSVAALNALVAAGFGVLELQSRLLSPHQRHLLWYLVIVLIGALVAALHVEQAFRDGVANTLWPEALLEGPRKLFAYPLSFIIDGLLVVAAVLCVASTHALHIGLFWIFFWPIMSLARVRSCLRPRPTSNTLPLLFGQMKPLQSDHWGTPPRPFSS